MLSNLLYIDSGAGPPRPSARWPAWPRATTPPGPPPASDIKPVSIIDEMRRSYLDYAMSVIVSRALPDVRDGLKPVHRRILYAMHDLGLQPNRPYRKSAFIVGEVMGKYHPHGDTAIYDTLVRMAQPWSMRLPMVDGHGNFGSLGVNEGGALLYGRVPINGNSGTAMAAPDWGKVPKRDIQVFHPGVSTIEWIQKKSDHSGSAGMRKGETCAGCHEAQVAQFKKGKHAFAWAAVKAMPDQADMLDTLGVVYLNLNRNDIRTAQELGISERTLYRKINEYKIAE